MFQKSLLKNFIKSFNTPHNNDVIKLVNKDKFIAEDANGAEFITLLSKFLNWNNCVREVKNNTDMKKADGVVYDKDNNPIAIVELKEEIEKLEAFVELSVATIDQMVYALYGLSDDEVALVEGER